MDETKKKKSFRLSADDIAYLEKVAKDYQGNTTKALEAIINKVRQMEDKVNQTSDTSGDKVSTVSDNRGTMGDNFSVATIPADVLETLQGQLAIKDDQIAALNQALLKAQDSNTELTKSLQAAQTLNAMDKPQTQPAAILEQSNETTPKADPPIGDMTFRQVWKLWRNARK